MYHSHTRFYLVGNPQRTFEIMKEMPPLDRFTHEFLESRGPDEALAAQSDIIVADLQGADGKAMLRTLATCKKSGAELILLAEKSQIEVLAGYGEEVYDIWAMPMSDAEVRFRFLKWQRSWKLDKDLWLTSQYLETTINSVPNLIWYKTKDGVHTKVNASFCEAAGKTREQVEGQDHFYIWDANPDDPETDGRSCVESERIVMENRETYVTEETVKTGAGMRLFTTYKSPLYDVDGSVMGTVGVGIDVTQERAYQRELVKQSRTVDTLFETLDCGAVRYAVDGRRILDVNSAALALLGCESREELGPAISDMAASFIVSEDQAKVMDFLAQVEAEGGGSIGYRIRRRDGGLRTVACDAELSEEDGAPICQWLLWDYS